MIANSSGQISRYTVEQFREWILNGVCQMSGLQEGMSDAFSPVGSQIGHSRELPWTEEVARLALMLDSAARHRFVSGLNEALSSFAGTLDSRSWLAPLHLIEVMRLVDADKRLRGLTAIADQLANEAIDMSVVERRGADRATFACGELVGSRCLESLWA